MENKRHLQEEIDIFWEDFLTKTNRCKLIKYLDVFHFELNEYFDSLCKPSKYGCTEKCAELLSKELNGEVDIINLKKVMDIDISKYEKVIIASFVRDEIR